MLSNLMLLDRFSGEAPHKRLTDKLQASTAVRTGVRRPA